MSKKSVLWTNEKRRLGDLKPWPRNPRQIKTDQAKRLVESFDQFGQVETLAIGPDGEIYNGHQRLNVLMSEQGADYEVDVRVASRPLDEKEREKLTIFLHKGAAGEWDFDVLANEFELDDLLEWGFSESELIGFSEGDNNAGEARKTLAERFIVPPFSVLDARQGYWQERKRAWIDIGINGELGRASFSSADARTFKGATQNSPTNMTANKTPSIFDPVLCELAYRWFCPTNAAILDPFAGGSVRGIVAALLGHDYTGIDLRPEQVEANEAQASEIVPDKLPRWIVGDSRGIPDMVSGEYDFIFSCPPYFDLELYSDDERDLSNAGDYAAFIDAYNLIVKHCVDRLEDNRFACFVVGDIRDKRGFYRNLVSDTIAAFHNAGAILYNEAILVTAVGTVMMQTSRNFPIARKLGKTHQNVLIFYKGDPKQIKLFGDVECGDIELDT